MRAWVVLTRVRLARWLARPSFWASFLLPVALIAVMGAALNANAQGESLVVGVYFPAQSDAMAEDFMNALAKVEVPPVTFVRAESRAQLEEMVAATAWECGYILPEDMAQRITAGTFTGVFERVTSPATSMQVLANTAMSSALLSLADVDVAASFLEGKGVMTRDEFLSYVEDGTLSAAPFSADYEIAFLSGDTVEEASEAWPGLLRGVMAVCLLLCFLLAALQLAQDEQTGFFSRARGLSGSAAATLSGPMAVCTAGVPTAFLMLILTACFSAGDMGQPVQECLLLLLYLIYLTAIACLVAVFSPGGGSVLAVLPLVVTASLILSPVFMDVTYYLPALTPVCCILPPTLYLRACDGELWAAALMGGLCVVLFALCALRLRLAPSDMERLAVEEQ